MNLVNFNFPGCWIIDTFYSYINYDKYNSFKEKLNISSETRYRYVQDAIEIYDIKDLVIGKNNCKVMINKSDNDSFNSTVFVLAAIPKEDYDRCVLPVLNKLNSDVLKYITNTSEFDMNNNFGFSKSILKRIKVIVCFVPDELCDIRSEEFDFVKYLTVVGNCIQNSIDASECTIYSYIPDFSGEIFIIVYFLQTFNTENGKEVIEKVFRNLKTFDVLDDKELNKLVEDIFDFIGGDINKYLNDYNSFYRFIIKVNEIIDKVFD